MRYFNSQSYRFPIERYSPLILHFTFPQRLLKYLRFDKICLLVLRFFLYFSTNFRNWVCKQKNFDLNDWGINFDYLSLYVQNQICAYII